MCLHVTDVDSFHIFGEEKLLYFCKQSVSLVSSVCALQFRFPLTTKGGQGPALHALANEGSGVQV